MKNFEQMSVSIFDDPSQNEEFLDWLILAVLFRLSMGLSPWPGALVYGLKN